MDIVDKGFSSPDFDLYAKQNIEESNLLAIIQRRLLPEEQEKFSYLVDKMETDELTEVEHSKFMAYVERVEREDAERARALVQLAEIRNVSPDILLASFYLEIVFRDYEPALKYSICLVSRRSR